MNNNDTDLGIEDATLYIKLVANEVCIISKKMRKTSAMSVLSNIYTMFCPSIRGDNIRALVSGLSSAQLKRVLLDFSLTVKAAPHECVIRDSQP